MEEGTFANLVLPSQTCRKDKFALSVVKNTLSPRAIVTIANGSELSLGSMKRKFNKYTLLYPNKTFNGCAKI